MRSCSGLIDRSSVATMYPVAVSRRTAQPLPHEPPLAGSGSAFGNMSHRPRCRERRRCPLGLICHLLASLQRERETPNAIRWPKSFKNVEDEARFELDDPGVSVEVSLWIWQACERRMVAQVEESLAGYLLLPTVRDLG